MTALAPRGSVDGLAPAARRLQARFGDVVDADTIRLVLDDCYERLRSRATVTTFLVILAERTAAARLAAVPGPVRASAPTGDRRGRGLSPDLEGPVPARSG